MIRTLDELKEQVSLVEYVEGVYDLEKVGAGTYRINPCPVCGGRDHFTINENGNYFNSFSECCKGGSIIDWFEQVEDMTLNEAIDKLYSLAGEERPQKGERSMSESNPIKSKKAPSQPQLDAQPQPNISELDYTQNITELHEATFKNVGLLTELREFAAERGVTAPQITENKWAVRRWKETVDGETLEYFRIIIPIWRNGKVVWYTQRKWKAPEESKQQRFLNATGSDGKNAIFNYDYLAQQHSEPIFLTESTIDAMNLETLGYKAIGINSTTNLNSFFDTFEKSQAKDAVLIAAFDNDSAGEKGRIAMKERGYSAIRIPTLKVNEKGEDKTDINDWFIDSVLKAQEACTADLDSLGIKVSIDNQTRLNGRPNNLESYLEHDLLSEIDKLQDYKNKKTGFDNLDKKMNGLNAGLYVVGGVSSVGKTTFVHQLGDQLAELGDHVLYFSLEQSRLEMVSKSLARESAKIDYTGALSSLDIRRGQRPALLSSAIENYKKYAGKVSIIEGNFDTNILTIRAYVEEYMQKNNVAPIVIIDYLQIMPATDKRMNDKQRVDENVTELKRLSRDLAIAVFVISSFNRSSYLAPVSFESFKESGGIEYTADAVWGIQLGVINSQDFIKLEKQTDKIIMVNKAKAEEIRDIELVCLKNRFGGLFECKFSYHMKHDYYNSNEGLGGFRTSPAATKQENGETFPKVEEGERPKLKL